MNFLAHIYLSGADPDRIIGNFLGDFVKGNDFLNFRKGIMEGILLHRAIDEYTDDHPVVSQSKDRLRKKYRHYSGVIVDVFYDHFLAKNWNDYHSMPLLEFTTQTYNILKKEHGLLPAKARHMLTYMARDNWLYYYGAIEGIDRALTGMSRRTKFNSKMDQAASELKEHYGAFEEEFSRFFPDAIKFANGWQSAT